MPAALFNWSILQFQAFVLILMRVAPILFLMPVLGSGNVPSLVKVSLCLAVSLILLPVIQINPETLPAEPSLFGFFLVSELMIGLILSLSVKIVLAGVQLAGEMAGAQMGLAIASMVDPQSDVNLPAVSQFLYLLALVGFLAADGHHWFFRAMVQSFSCLAPGEIYLRGGLYTHFMQLAASLFTIAVKIAAPVLAVLMFAQIAMGILAKAVPQVNILMTSFTLTIGVGLAFLALSLDLVLPKIQLLLEEAARGLGSTLLPLMRK